MKRRPTINGQKGSGRMRDQALSRELGKYGPFDHDAELLLRAGFELANQRLLSGPHIVLAALRWDYLRNMLFSSQHVRGIQQLSFLLQRNGLGIALKSWIDLPVDYPADETVTYGLAAALRAGRAAAHKNPLTVVQLLQVVLTHDVDVLATTSSLGAGSSTYTAWPSPPSPSSLPSLPSGSGSQPHMAMFSYPIVRREATTTRRYAGRHHIQIEHVLRELAERREDQVLLARGLYGSPLCRLEHVLADLLIAPQRDVVPDKLASYNYVLKQDVAKLHAAGMEEAGGAVDVLQWALSLARSWHTILILTRGELLCADDRELANINRRILGTLLQTGGVPVIITFEELNQTLFEEPRALPLINAREVKMPPYSEDNAISAIHDYYDAAWREAKILVRSADALAYILQIEPAIYASEGGIIKRKVLPYSMEELLQEAIETIHREISSGGYIRALALTAKQRIEALLHDRNEGRMLFAAVDLLDQITRTRSDQPDIVAAARVIKERWQPRCELLLDLPDRMQRLADNPTIQQATQGVYILAPEIVTAQFFSDTAYHLRLVQAFEVDVCAYEPRLLNEIQRAYE